MLAMLLGAGVWVLVRPTQYSATSQVLVTPAPYYDPTYLGLAGVVRDTPGDPFRAVETAATVLDSPSAAAATAQRLGPGWTAGRVRASITVVPVGGTNVLAIQSDAAQAGLATRLANEFATAALDDRRRVLAAQALALVSLLRETPTVDATRIARLRAVSGGIDPTFSLLHPATGLGSASALGLRQVLIIALFAGLILGTGLALLSDGALRRNPRVPEDLGGSNVARLPSLPAGIPDGRRRRDDSPQP
jgi:capsular polysaccharide biosynthesis protein